VPVDEYWGVVRKFSLPEIHTTLVIFVAERAAPMENSGYWHTTGWKHFLLGLSL